MLNPVRIRHHIVKIYSVVKNDICDAIVKHVTSKPIPHLSFTVDKVMSKVSGSASIYLGQFWRI